VKQIACAVEDMNVQLCVSTPIGSIYQTDQIVKNYSIIIQDKKFFADHAVLGIQWYDVILGMD